MEPPSPPQTPNVQIERAVAPIAFPDPALEQVLRGYPGTCQRQGGLRYIYNRVDLDGDRHPETVVALLGRQHCDNGGCPLLLLKDFGRTILPLQMIHGFQTTLVVAERRTFGWSDLILPRTRGPQSETPMLLSHNGRDYPISPPLNSGKSLSNPIRGVATLLVQPSPHQVQGHPLSCPPPARDQRKSVFSKVPMARPRSSLLLEDEREPLRPAVWVATRLMSAQRKMPVTPWFT